MDSEDTIRLNVIHDLERAIGPQSALYIMSKLPVVNWHELATKADLREMREEMATKDDLRVLAAELRAEMHQGFASQTRWLVTYITGWSAVVLAAAKVLL